MKKLALIAVAAFLVSLSVPPKSAHACPLICRPVHGALVCGCG